MTQLREKRQKAEAEERAQSQARFEAAEEAKHRRWLSQAVSVDSERLLSSAYSEWKLHLARIRQRRTVAEHHQLENLKSRMLRRWRARTTQVQELTEKAEAFAIWNAKIKAWNGWVRMYNASKRWKKEQRKMLRKQEKEQQVAIKQRLEEVRENYQARKNHKLAQYAFNKWRHITLDARAKRYRLKHIGVGALAYWRLRTEESRAKTTKLVEFVDGSDRRLMSQTFLRWYTASYLRPKEEEVRAEQDAKLLDQTFDRWRHERYVPSLGVWSFLIKKYLLTLTCMCSERCATFKWASGNSTYKARSGNGGDPRSTSRRKSRATTG